MPPSNAFVPIKQELLGKAKESGEGGANQDGKRGKVFVFLRPDKEREELFIWGEGGMEVRSR